MARKFDIGDEVYHVSENGLYTEYKISQIYEHEPVSHYVKVERTSNLFLNSSTQEQFMVDEHLKAKSLKRKIILEKWKK